MGGPGDPVGVARESCPWLSTLFCDICDGRDSMRGLLRCGGSSGGVSSFRARFELALLCEVPGLRPLGDWSNLGGGSPFCLRCSSGGTGGGGPSCAESNDLCDLIDCASSPGGRRPGLRAAGTLTGSGVRGGPANSGFEDWGVRFRNAKGGVGGTGSRPGPGPGPGRGRMLSPLGRERRLCSIERFCLRSGSGGVG